MLSKILKETILKNGAISFRDFMASALYHPEYGYYTSGIAEIGHKGDFYTSPSLHPIFGVVIAKQIEQMWEVMEMPKIFDIVEFGSGVGYLANDILNSISGQFRDSLRYNVIEVNPKSIQTLSRNLSSKIRIIKDISELNNIEGCILSNELIDAQPVQIVEMVNGSLREIYLDSELKEVYRDCSSEIIEYIKEFAPDLPDNYRTEVNLELRRWINDVYRVLSKGFVLTIDYGYTAREYYDVERGRGTLVCYHKHSVNENPYINIGKQDITSHVNFSALKRWGGMDVVGYCTQGMFLASMGIDEILSELDGVEYPQAVNRVKEMIMPGGMGQSHKVLIQSKGMGEVLLRGFNFSNKKGFL
ncbi:MAG: SAM-dependent methyltransferase [Nitrospirae bacterium]|nr:SAM-dependent methyltransferase [Nitrospirota bacterium]